MKIVRRIHRLKTRSHPDNWDWGPPKHRPSEWPDDQDIRRFMEWLRGLIPQDDWKRRRFAHVSKLHGAEVYLSRADTPALPQTYVADDDVGGWYLMLAEAYVDHIADYEPAQGSRIIPLFKALGRDFELLMTIEGVENRARRILTTERKQPDGALFELLVALSYRRDGWPIVRFIEEDKGGSRRPDIQVFAPIAFWSVECKRISRSQYSKDERDQFWRLWRHAMGRFEAEETNLFFDLDFKREIAQVPDAYIDDLATRLMKSSSSIVVDDEWAVGEARQLDLRPIRKLLQTDVVLGTSQRFFELVIGNYELFASHSVAMKIRPWENNARYIDSLDFATVARWRCSAPTSVKAKARHFLRQIADANEQLRDFGPGVIHIRLEAMEGNEVEIARRPKILRMAANFRPRDTDLRWLYLHYFVHNSPPQGGWTIDETTDWFAMKRPPGPAPRRSLHLVVPPDCETAPHPWDQES